MVEDLTKQEKYTLVDCWGMHEQYPDTFEIPDADEIDSIKEGTLIKLIFTDPDGGNGERMWVVVTDVIIGNLGKTFFGTLDNDPFIHEDTLQYKDKITFQPRHVASIWET